MSVNLKEMSVSEILSLSVEINEELRSRDILRSANNPTGDLAEYLFCTAYGWEQAPNSERGYDATCADGVRYQIKGRRIHGRNKSRQLSAIRDFDGNHFDILAGVLFDDDYNVLRAALIPRSIIGDKSKYVAHTNSNRFMLSDDIWLIPDVIDATFKVKAALP